MRAAHRSSLPLLLSLGLLLTGCGDAGDPAALSPDGALDAHAAPSSAVHTYTAHLTGAAEVPVVETRARGEAVFRLSSDGTELSYRLIVANIEDVLMSHIHLAPAGANGPVVVWLYPEGGGGPALIEGRFSGVLAEGTITADDLIGSLGGEPLSALIAELDAGNAYVNVHTSANPPGEVRGQIMSGM